MEISVNGKNFDSINGNGNEKLQKMETEKFEMQTHKFGPICFVSVVFLFHVISAKFLM